MLRLRMYDGLSHSLYEATLIFQNMANWTVPGRLVHRTLLGQLEGFGMFDAASPATAAGFGASGLPSEPKRTTSQWPVIVFMTSLTSGFEPVVFTLDLSSRTKSNQTVSSLPSANRFEDLVKARTWRWSPGMPLSRPISPAPRPPFETLHIPIGLTQRTRWRVNSGQGSCRPAVAPCSPETKVLKQPFVVHSQISAILRRNQLQFFPTHHHRRSRLRRASDSSNNADVAPVFRIP